MTNNQKKMHSGMDGQDAKGEEQSMKALMGKSVDE
jgi:hypothetical protein